MLKELTIGNSVKHNNVTFKVYAISEAMPDKSIHYNNEATLTIQNAGLITVRLDEISGIRIESWMLFNYGFEYKKSGDKIIPVLPIGSFAGISLIGLIDPEGKVNVIPSQIVLGEEDAILVETYGRTEIKFLHELENFIKFSKYLK